MITEFYKSGSYFASQRLRARTELFGKEYYWLTDIDNTWYLLPVGPDDKPVFA